MNRKKLRDKLIEIQRYLNPKEDNSRVKDRTLFGRVYRALKLNPPKSTNRMRDSLKEWLRNKEYTAEALLEATYESYNNSPGATLPKRLLVPREPVKDQRDVNQMVVSNLPSSKFYQTKEWRELRYQALVKYGNNCVCCGASPKHGVSIHVDHIKPRSIYPEYALCIDNLQILCESCNVGKSNQYDTDWRRRK